METPIIFREGACSERDLATFIRRYKIWKIKDVYKSQVAELYQIKHPEKTGAAWKKDLARFIAKMTSPNPKTRGNYVYFPWSGFLFHMVGEDDLTTLRTNRTRNLVTTKEQGVLGGFTAGVAGLSFGNGIALALAYSGMAKSMKLADMDVFETTNLNRVRVGIPSIGDSKVSVTAREIYEINPYADITAFPDGLNEKNIPGFAGGTPKTNIIFDVVDDFATKVRIRLAARSAGVPVVMLTSLEDSVLVDVERFDLNKSADIFHGLLGSVTDELLTRKMTEKEKAKYAMAIVGPDNVSYRNILSLSEIGYTLVSRPHLYGTVSIVCGLAAFIARRIALNEDMPSMRKLVAFHEILGIASSHDDTPQNRSALLSRFMSESP